MEFHVAYTVRFICLLKLVSFLTATVRVSLIMVWFVHVASHIPNMLGVRL